ncbi:hypothetical protein D3C86_1855370 [compost metagenome]
MLRSCLLIAALTLAGCASCPTPSTLPSKPPPLDSALAAPCTVPDAPAVADYDLWQDWVMKDLLGAMGECAARHRKTVEAWPG